jgi:hypothetical protein
MWRTLCARRPGTSRQKSRSPPWPSELTPTWLPTTMFAKRSTVPPLDHRPSLLGLLERENGTPSDASVTETKIGLTARLPR